MIASNDGDVVNATGIRASSTFKLDLEVPKIKNITTATATGKYNVASGANMAVTINFEDSLGAAKSVTSTGAVTIKLETGDNDYNCVISSISNSSTGTCYYSVRAGDNSSDLNAISVAGTFTDNTGNVSVNPIIPSGKNIGDNSAIPKDIVIDTINPIISGVLPATDAYFNSNTSANGGSDISYTNIEKLNDGSYLKLTSTQGSDSGTQYISVICKVRRWTLIFIANLNSSRALPIAKTILARW